MQRFRMKAYLLLTLLLGVFILPGCGGDAGNGHWDQPNVIPTVLSTAPAPAALGVPIGNNLTVTFNGEMDPATLASPATSFTVKEFLSNAPVNGVVIASGNTATFNPDADLLPLTEYAATITTGAMNLAGQALASDYVWRFTTGAAVDTSAPFVSATSITDGAIDQLLNIDITATFNEAMDPATLVSPATNFTVKEFVSNNAVSGVVTYLGNTATFNPDADLLPDTEYIATISADAKDLAGLALTSGPVPNPWRWTTGAAADIVAPEITLTSPVDGDIDIPVDSTITATFNEEMSQATMIAANFTVVETDTLDPVTGMVEYDSLIATFTPSAPLKPSTEYTVTVTDAAQDLAGNALVVPAVAGLPVPNPWTFTTADAVIPPEVPLAINLGLAESFGIASQEGLTSTGVTVVNGDVALYPLAGCTDSTGNAGAGQDCLVQTYSSPTGMTVNGSIYWAGDPFDSGATALAVTNDLNTAWIEGKNKVPTQPTVAGDQLASVIAYLPGVYHNATLGLEAGGIATLDAENDLNAIFIFQVDSSFVDSGTLLQPTQIVLVNGAQARNVWFVTGLDATIGSGSTWNGNILAGRSVTVNDGSTVMGRVLAGASGAGAFVLTGAASPSLTTITVPE